MIRSRFRRDANHGSYPQYFILLGLMDSIVSIYCLQLQQPGRWADDLSHQGLTSHSRAADLMTKV